MNTPPPHVISEQVWTIKNWFVSWFSRSISHHVSWFIHADVIVGMYKETEWPPLMSYSEDKLCSIFQPSQLKKVKKIKNYYECIILLMLTEGVCLIQPFTVRSEKICRFVGLSRNLHTPVWGKVDWLITTVSHETSGLLTTFISTNKHVCLMWT